MILLFYHRKIIQSIEKSIYWLLLLSYYIT
jgi:hypothetical protein